MDYANLGLAFLWGTILGSFMNVVIHRLPIMRENAKQRKLGWSVPQYNLSVPRSACVQCKHQITWYENVPIMSYLLLRGKCSECKTKIHWRYPLVEFMFGLAFVLLYLATRHYLWPLLLNHL